MKFPALLLMALAQVFALGPRERVVSPNKAYVLYGNETAAQLWLENTRTHERRMVMEVTIQTMAAAWSPDSSAFAVSDRWASDIEMAYIYDAKSLERLDISPQILAAYPDTARFVPGPDAAPHSYCHVVRWLDPQHVEVRLHGHTDGVRVGNSIHPGDCFDLRFRVSRGGKVEQLSRRVLPISDAQGCEAIGD